MLVLAAVFTLLASIDQRKLWYVTRGWTYANPAANEPSEAYLAFIRGSLILMAAGSIFMGVCVMSAADAGPSTGAEQSSGDEYDYPTWEADDSPTPEYTGPQHGTALGLLGSERFERHDGPESPESDVSGPEGQATKEWDQALPPSAQTVRAILPDQAAMRPSRVDDQQEVFDDQREEPEVGSAGEAYICEVIDALCVSLQAYGDLEYATTSGSHVVEFQVLAYDSSLAAQRALDGVRLYYSGSADYLEVYDPEYDRDFGSDAMTSYADYTTTFDDGSHRAVIDFVRQGPYLGVVWLAADYGYGHDPDNVGIERRLSQLISHRMEQAKQGGEPSGTVGDAYRELYLS